MEIYTHALDDNPARGDAVALLFGVTVEELHAEYDRQAGRLAHGRFVIPDQWERNCRRIAREAAAALGYEPDMHETLAYLRAQQAGQ